MNVPKLRFGEFEGDWKIKTIGEITSKVGSGSTPSGGAQIYTNSGIPFIRSQNINNDQLIFDDATYIPQLVHEKMQGSAVQANDVLLNITGASIGRSCVVPSNFVEGNVNQHVSIIRFINGYVPHFYQKYLSSSRGQKHISSLQVGSGREGLNFQAIRTIAIPSPEINEQQKIADFLSAVDEKITALTAQKTALTQYKQGMMQRIFTQTLRFKDDNGADYPDWEKKALGEISLFITNGLALEQNQEQSGYKVTRIETISDKKINLNKVGYVETEQDISDYKLYVGDILLSNINSISHIGKVVYVDDDYDLYHGMNLLRISIMKEKHDSKFVFFQLSTPHMKQEFETKANKAVNQASINQTEIKKLILQVPSLAEQTKVAQFLTECDDKINAVDAQIQSAQQWKQGLLQQMFV